MKLFESKNSVYYGLKGPVNMDLLMKKLQGLLFLKIAKSKKKYAVGTPG